MKKFIAILTFGALASSCNHDTQFAGQGLLKEGVGIPGYAQIGESAKNVKKRFGSPDQVARFPVGPGLEETEFRFDKLSVFVDTINEGHGDRVCRVSVNVSDASTRVFKTGLGLQCTAGTRRNDIIDIYGEPVNSFPSFADVDVAKSIKMGIPYAIKRELEQFEYLHYPSLGIAFVLTEGVCRKVSIEEPRTRRIWRY